MIMLFQLGLWQSRVHVVGRRNVVWHSPPVCQSLFQARVRRPRRPAASTVRFQTDGNIFTVGAKCICPAGSNRQGVQRKQRRVLCGQSCSSFRCLLGFTGTGFEGIRDSGRRCGRPQRAQRLRAVRYDAVYQEVVSEVCGRWEPGSLYLFFFVSLFSGLVGRRSLPIFA